MTAIFETLLGNASGGTITNAFALFIILAFLAALICIRNSSGKMFISYAPAFLTSLGILGTFTGIVVGLLEFNVDDIDGSIPPLLEGLKTAFITSLLGLTFALLFKLVQSSGLLAREESSSSTEDVTPSDILAGIKEQGIALNTLKEAIAGEDEGTLLGQLKLTRSDINDNHKLFYKAFNTWTDKRSTEQTEFADKLWIKLQDFADMMSKSATEAVIEALREVITDFNNNLTEQFGDNFKQLNEAVIALVQWQENYKEQIQSMIEQYAMGVEAIDNTSSSVEKIRSDAQIIPEVMNELSEVVKVNQHQISELDNHLNAFSEIRDKAVEAVPQIREQIDLTVSAISDSAQTMSTQLTESASKIEGIISEGAKEFTEKVHVTNASLQSTADHLSQGSENIKNHLGDTVDDISKHTKTMIDGIVSDSKEISTNFNSASSELISKNKELQSQYNDQFTQLQKSFSASLDEMVKEQDRHAREIFHRMDTSLQEQVNRTGQAVQSQMDMIDQSMTQELERVMQEMGNALAQISGQFTKDYSELVKVMTRITRERA